MCKKILSMLLVLALTFGGIIGADAAASDAMTVEQRINNLELNPQPVPDWAQYHPDWYDFSRVYQVTNESMTNYEKLQAVFLDISQNTPVTSCTSHQRILIAAFNMLGFKAWEVNGLTKSKGGGPTFSYGRVPDGWCSHSWVAIEIDGPPLDNLILWEDERRDINDIMLGYGYTLSDVEGEFLYFDSNLFATYGMNFSQCFAVQPQHATWYRDAYFYQAH